MPTLVPRPPPFFVFRFVFNIIVLNDYTELKLNANQFQSHMPRVGRSQIAQDLVVNGIRLNVPLLCGMQVDWQITLQV